MLDVKSSNSLSEEEEIILNEVRKDPKLLRILKDLIVSLKKNL